MTDEELVKGCVQENATAQRMLFDKYAGKMMTVCLRYARHRMEAEDILQDAFIKVFDNLKKFEFKGSFEGWIRRIVINTALKGMQRMSFTHENIGLENSPENFEEANAISLLSEKELLRLIAELPEGYRAVFNMYVFDDFSHREIGNTLNIEESTSRSQLAKARNWLKIRIIDAQKVAI